METARQVSPQPGLVGQWLVGALVVVLLAGDAVPALRGLPLVLLGLMAVVQMGREAGAALDQRQVHPSTPLMNFWGAIVFLHVVYFSRSAHWSTAIEVTNTVLIALFLLVVVAALTTEAKFLGWRQGVRDLGLALALPALFGLGIGAGAAIQAGAAHLAQPTGSQLLALIVAALWLSNGAAAVGDRLAIKTDDRPDRVPATPAGAVARVVAMVVVLAVGGLALGVLKAGAALAAGLAGGVGGWLAHWLVDRGARYCHVDRFHTRLPSHISALQPRYDRWFDGGALDYMGSFLLALPAIHLALHLIGG